jgi:hypothetical protein
MNEGSISRRSFLKKTTTLTLVATNMSLLTGLVYAGPGSIYGWVCTKESGRGNPGCYVDQTTPSGYFKCACVGGGTGLCDKQYGGFDDWAYVWCQ